MLPLPIDQLDGLPNMSRDGLWWVLIPVLGALAAATTGHLTGGTWLFLLAVGLFLLAVFMAYFFRDPHRIIPDDDDVVVSPADGRVTRVEAVADGEPQSPNVISIFLSPLDVHVNRAPIAGEIIDAAYTKGKFMMATRDEASLVNEQNALTIRGRQMTIVCKQIAGVLARRIVCWKGVGDHLARGERFGLIKFSSRTDLILPAGIEITVRVGDRVRGGVSVVGRIRQ